MIGKLNAVEIVLALRARGVELETEGKRLVLRGSRKSLSRSLRAELRDREREVVQVVKAIEGGAVIFTVKHTRAPRQQTAIM